MTDAERGAAIAKSMGESALAASVAANVAGVKQEVAQNVAQATASNSAAINTSAYNDALQMYAANNAARMRKILLWSAVIAVGGVIVYFGARRHGRKR